MISTIDPRTAVASRGRRFLAALGRRWPTALALVLATATLGIDTTSAGTVLPLLPLLYVVVVALRRPSMSWPALIVLLAGYVALDEVVGVDPVPAIIAVAAGFAAVGLLRRGGRREVLVQAAGMVGFTGLALFGLAAAPTVATLLIAAGWLGHGVWDLVHLWRRAAVSRSYAEWCAVVDIVLAAELVTLL